MAVTVPAWIARTAFRCEVKRSPPRPCTMAEHSPGMPGHVAGWNTVATVAGARG